MSVGAKLGSRTRPEKLAYTNWPSEHVTVACTVTTVFRSRSDTVKPIRNGLTDTVPRNRYACPTTSL